MLAKAQGRRREAGSGGSVAQSRDLTNRNRVLGSKGRTSGQRPAKSISIKGPRCRSGRCAVKAVKLTPGGLRRVPEPGLREPRGDQSAAQKSAEGVVGVGNEPGGSTTRRPHHTEGPNG